MAAKTGESDSIQVATHIHRFTDRQADNSPRVVQITATATCFLCIDQLVVF